MKFPVFSQLAGNLRPPETMRSSTGESVSPVPSMGRRVARHPRAYPPDDRRVQFRRPVSAIAGAAGRRAGQGSMVQALRRARAARTLRAHHAELGHGQQGDRAQRLQRLYDLGCAGQEPLSTGPKLTTAGLFEQWRGFSGVQGPALTVAEGNAAAMAMARVVRSQIVILVCLAVLTTGG
jgi:hypothetical protein